MAADALGGEYTLLFNGIEVERFAKATPWPTEGSDAVLRRSPRAPQGARRAARCARRAARPTCGLWVAGDGPETAELQRRHGRRRPHRVARSHRRRREGVAPAGGGRVLRTVAARRVVRGRAARGHGRPDAGGGEQPARATRTWPGPAPTRCWCRRATPTALADAVPPPAVRRRLAAELVASGESRAAEFSMDHLAERYLELFEVAGALTLGTAGHARAWTRRGDRRGWRCVRPMRETRCGEWCGVVSSAAGGVTRASVQLGQADRAVHHGPFASFLADRTD